MVKNILCYFRIFDCDGFIFLLAVIKNGYGISQRGHIYDDHLEQDISGYPEQEQFLIDFDFFNVKEIMCFHSLWVISVTKSFVSLTQCSF